MSNISGNMEINQGHIRAIEEMEIKGGEEDDVCIWSSSADDTFSTKLAWE